MLKPPAQTKNYLFRPSRARAFSATRPPFFNNTCGNDAVKRPRLNERRRPRHSYYPPSFRRNGGGGMEGQGQEKRTPSPPLSPPFPSRTPERKGGSARRFASGFRGCAKRLPGTRRVQAGAGVGRAFLIRLRCALRKLSIPLTAP
jgi:hypothetical protein